MMDQIKERCIYCGADVYYTGIETLIKCGMCGHSLVVAKFENELAKLNAAIEEGEQAKRDLEEARREKQAADDRLFAALSSLGDIRDEQDALGKVLHLLSQEQGDALKKFEFVKGISKKIIQSQHDIFAQMSVMQEISAHLQMIDLEGQERQSVMRSFMLWSQQIREEDIQRLQEIDETADKLLSGQQEIKRKIQNLQKAADQHQQTLESFYDQYTKDKLVRIQKLFHQAENYQHDRRFNKAEEYYQKVLTEGDEDVEVYWRLLMCHYCLFYQKDDEGHLIPIILNPDLTDPAEMSLRRELDQHITEHNKSYYEMELDKIDQILDKYRELKDKVQYDVFISVKQDAEGHYTSDSDIASDLYDFLTKQGLRVFNSRRTGIPVGQEFEPYIISALISSKVLIVVGTTPENMNSTWVKNEWSRFQWLQFHEKAKRGKTERVLFCYLAKDMQARQIPKALHPDRQAIYDGVKAHDELLAGLEFLKKKQSASVNHKTNSADTPEADYAHVERQMKFWLLQKKYSKVQEKYEQLTDKGMYLEHASLHLAALCANNKVRDINELADSEVILENFVEFQAARMFCQNNEEKEKLDELLKQNKNWRIKKDLKKNVSDNNATANALDKGRVISDNQSSIVSSTNEPAYEQQRKTLQKERSIDCDAIFAHETIEKSSTKEIEPDSYPYPQKTLCDMEQQSFSDELVIEVDEKPVSESNQEQIKVQETPDEWFHFGEEAEKEKNYKEAIMWYQKAAEAGYEKAQYKMGECYINGHGIDFNAKKAIYWFREAAKQNNALAQYQIAEIFYEGIGIQKNLEPAIYWYQKAAEQENDLAQIQLADMYYNGIGVEKDAKKAVYWYQRAAEHYNVRAQYCLGRCYQYGGKRLSKNMETAVYWYQKAAEQGYEEAKQKLDKLSSNDWYKLAMAAKNKENMVKCLEKAAEAGQPNAQLRLGSCYQYGEGIKQNQRKAVFWYKKAAEQEVPEAQYLLGKCYLDGCGTKRDEETAASMYRLAAEHGVVDAQNSLAWLYITGIGVKINLEQAVYWYKKAAEQGDCNAQMHLAGFYEKGEGVEKDLKQAEYWYQKAAEDGYSGSQYELGLFYERQDDLQQAVYWFQKVAKQGSINAIEKLKKIEKIQKEREQSEENKNTTDQPKKSWIKKLFS